MTALRLLSLSHFVAAQWRFTHLRGCELRHFQDERAKRIIEFARTHSPFYAHHFAGLDTENWRKCPTIDKAAMMAHFGDFNTRGIGRDEAMSVALRAERERDFSPRVDELTVGLSSGTSGYRGLFLLSAQEQAAWAGTILARALPGFKADGWKVAFFLRSNSNLYEEVSSRFVRFRYFDLMTPIEEAVSRLNDFAPDILVAPPSMLGLLADCARLHIRPERVVSVAEVLEPQDARRLQNAFGCQVGQIYQCTEGLLAVSCPHGSLHVQEDVVALDFEPQSDGRVTPIVTDLWRRLQPIIRYRLNDVLVLSPRRCACGSDFQIIERIEGRSDDVCFLEALDGKRRPVFPDAIRRAVLLASASITDYRATQERDGSLHIALEVAQDADFRVVEEAIRRELDELRARFELRPFKVFIEPCVSSDARDTKRRRVRRLT